MMLLKSMFLPLLSLVLLVDGAEDVDREITCPPDSGTITMAGAENARQVVEAWAEGFAEICPGVSVQAEGGGYPMGASRVCDDHIVYRAVDVGGMEGPFFYPQASTLNGWSFQCKQSERQTYLVHVAQEGITFETNIDGPAAECIQFLGGLNTDQIRWIYSNLPMTELDHTGWKLEAVPNSDGDDSTHLWSELNGNCSAIEIDLAGLPQDTLAYTFLKDHILTAAGEAPRNYYQSTSMEELDNFLMSHENAVSFFPMHDILSVKSAHRIPKIASIAIQDEYENFVMPDAKSFASSEYPLLRNVYLGIHNDPASLALTRPFIEFGFSQRGHQLLQDAGFWPIPEWEQFLMETRIQSQHGMRIDDISEHCGPAGEKFSIAGDSLVQPISHKWAGLFQSGCDVTIELEGGDSATGASRICGNYSVGEPIDIANMLRDWTDGEGSEREGTPFVHDCERGDQRRSAIQFDVALDGIVIVVPRDGAGHNCFQHLGGVSGDQLRWIFSNYKESELKGSGWDPRSVVNSDGNPSTHKWNELDPRCENEEIVLMGDNMDILGDQEFARYVFKEFEKGENIDQLRPVGYTAGDGRQVLTSLLKEKNAIGFVGFHNLFHIESLFTMIPIIDERGSLIAPSNETITDRTYPIIQAVHMNLFNIEESLKNTRPLLEFGLMHPELTVPSGLTPIRGEYAEKLLDRLYASPYEKAESDESGVHDDDIDFSIGMIIGVIAGALVILVLAVYICLRMYYETAKQFQ